MLTLRSQIPTNMLTSSVSGFIVDGGSNPNAEDASITLYYQKTVPLEL
ncbi:MAG: hypothetical protein R2827_13085 [Bdellovibrionales bacterium]